MTYDKSTGYFVLSSGKRLTRKQLEQRIDAAREREKDQQRIAEQNRLVVLRAEAR